MPLARGMRLGRSPMLAATLLPLALMLAERIALDQINAGFDKMRAGHSARSVIVFDA